MPQKLEKIKRFLKELQRSNNSRKKRWLIGTTIFSMLFVLGLWFVYINTVGIPSLVPENVRQAQTPEDSTESVWQIFKRGLNKIFKDVEEQLKISKELIEKQLQKTNELIITPTSTATSSPVSE